MGFILHWATFWRITGFTVRPPLPRVKTVLKKPQIATFLSDYLKMEIVNPKSTGWGEVRSNQRVQMSNIILARQKIQQIARELRNSGERDLATRLSSVIDLMHRRRPARRMPSHSRSVTPQIRQQVLELARTTDMHSAEIAVHLNLNPGRVSEILQGDR